MTVNILCLKYSINAEARGYDVYWEIHNTEAQSLRPVPSAWWNYPCLIGASMLGPEAMKWTVTHRFADIAEVW